MSDLLGNIKSESAHVNEILFIVFPPLVIPQLSEYGLESEVAKFECQIIQTVDRYTESGNHLL